VWSTWSLIDDRAALDGVVIAAVPAEYAPFGAGGRIAVLTDGAVANAGEAVAVAFRGRGGARSFGAPTCGQTTGISLIPLEDGSALGLAVARIADRDSVQYLGPLVPDETIADEGTLVARAIAWIRDGI
jgi:C-terminal processing protease CtpA/Prc